MRAIYLICRCGHQATVPWPMDRTTLRDQILPLTRCTFCGRRAVDMRIIWEPQGNPLDGARTEVKRFRFEEDGTGF